MLIYTLEVEWFCLGYITTESIRTKERKFLYSSYYFILEIHKEKTDLNSEKNSYEKYVLLVHKNILFSC